MAPKRNSLLPLSGVAAAAVVVVVVSPSSLAYLLSKPLPPPWKPLLRSFQELMHFPPLPFPLATAPRSVVQQHVSRQ